MAAPRNDNIKQKILDAATRLLLTTAFDSITLAVIARAASISKGTLYYYYNNKDDILFDITDRYLDTLMNDLLAWVDTPAKDTRLPRLVRYVLQRGAAPECGNLRLYLIGAGVSGHEELRSRYVERYTVFHATLSARIAQRVPGADAAYLTWLLFTVMDGILVQTQLGNPAFCADEFCRKTAQLVTQAFGGAAAQQACDSQEKDGFGQGAAEGGSDDRA